MKSGEGFPDETTRVPDAVLEAAQQVAYWFDDHDPHGPDLVTRRWMRILSRRLLEADLFAETGIDPDKALTPMTIRIFFDQQDYAYDGCGWNVVEGSRILGRFNTEDSAREWLAAYLEAAAR